MTIGGSPTSSKLNREDPRRGRSSPKIRAPILPRDGTRVPLESITLNDHRHACRCPHGVVRSGQHRLRISPTWSSQLNRDSRCARNSVTAGEPASVKNVLTRESERGSGSVSGCPAQPWRTELWLLRISYVVHGLGLRAFSDSLQSCHLSTFPGAVSIDIWSSLARVLVAPTDRVVPWRR